VERKTHAIPKVQFTAGYGLTSFAGLAVIQEVFKALNFREALAGCFGRDSKACAFRTAVIAQLLVLHILLGFRKLKEIQHYENDVMVKRLLGLDRLPDASTVSRRLSSLGEGDVANIRQLMGDIVLDRLRMLDLLRVSLDFDGTVQSTQGHAEGTAVGFNKTKKGARGYYPLMCTVAQTSQFLDGLHRPGNVHDSRDALEFMRRCIGRVAAQLPTTPIEVRMDSAFFGNAIVNGLDAQGVTFTVSVPFERFAVLKPVIESVQDDDWERVDDNWSVAVKAWKPKSWSQGFRFVLARQRRRIRQKGPMQLDLFVPVSYEYEYTAVMTNRLGASAADVLRAHHGRGAQERALGEAKQFAALDLVAGRSRNGNEAFTIAGLIAHNLGRELQIGATPPTRDDGPKRSSFWAFESLRTLRYRWLCRAALLVRPGGVLTLRLPDEPALRESFETYQSYVG